MPDAVVAALAGVVVGALLNYVLTWRLERRRELRVARGAARILLRDVFEALVAINAAADGKRAWPPGSSFRFPVENWERLSVDLSRGLADDWDWQSVCIAFESMEEENTRIRDNVATSDPDHLKRIRDRDFHGALDVLDALNTPTGVRLRRFWHRAKERLPFRHRTAIPPPDAD